MGECHRMPINSGKNTLRTSHPTITDGTNLIYSSSRLRTSVTRWSIKQTSSNARSKRRKRSFLKKMTSLKRLPYSRTTSSE